MSKILKFILEEKRTIDEVEKLIKKGYSKISLFKPMPELKNKTLFEHFEKYKKLKGLTLEDLINAKAINVDEKNHEGLKLIQVYVKTGDIHKVKMLLPLGVPLRETDLHLTDNEEMQHFLNYQPGSNEPSILKFCSKRQHADYIEKVQAILLDEANTSEEESSEAESWSSDSLDEEEQEELDAFRQSNLKKYNQNPDKYLSNNRLCLLAARGVHFSPKYFSQEAINNVKETKSLRHTTYSQSTLFDAGYAADECVSESDLEMLDRHNYNIEFIENLKEENDHKERRIGAHNPPATRNKIVFDNLYYRFMQVYINSYSTLFNIGSIQVDFGFDSLWNPLVSASWNIEKAAMYESGSRIDWKPRSLRRDPHYRRFTGKPKHPNMGYLDVFAFDVAYVRANGFDRTLMCKDGFINLSSLFRYEAEVIFNSMIPKAYHKNRFILSVPRFDLSYEGNKQYFLNYGITTKRVYSSIKQEVVSLPKAKKSDEYKNTINKVVEKAANAQSAMIKKTIDYRLFKSKKSKAVVFDHGDKLDAQPFQL